MHKHKNVFAQRHHFYLFILVPVFTDTLEMNGNNVIPVPELMWRHEFTP